MTDSIDRYITHLRQPSKGQRSTSPETLRATCSDLTGFVRWWEKEKEISFDPALVLDTDLLEWHDERYDDGEGVKATTLNRARSSLLGFFRWAQEQGLVSHNPATALPLLDRGDIDPRSTPPEGVDWLIRMASAQADATARLRDLALLTLLSDCGLRSQEAASVQLRDLDLDGETLLVRKGKRNKARRVPLPDIAVRRFRDYLRVRCPDWPLETGHEHEQEPLLIARQVAKPGQPWEPGMKTVSMRKMLHELGRDAAARVREQAKKEPSVSRVGELHRIADRLEEVSPHRLRHGLAYRLKQSQVPLEDIGRVLGHSKPQITTVMYGKAFEDDLRESLDVASQYKRRAKKKDR